VKGAVVVLILAALLLPASAQAADPVQFNVVFLMAETPQDHGWNAAHWRAIQDLKSLGVIIKDGLVGFTVQLPDGNLLNVSTIQQIGYNVADIERYARQAVNSGADLVVGTWFDSATVLAALAEEYPDVKFLHVSGYPMVKSNGRNFSTYFIRQEQGDYAAGVGIARAMLHQHGVGMVGTFYIPEPVRAVNGFLLGMQSVDPTATMTVVWIQSWLDQQKEILAAEGLIAEGFGLIRQLADTPYSSITACDAGIPAVGYGTDVPCAQITNEWNWGPAYVFYVSSLIDGTWTAGDRWEGFETGAVVMKGPLAPSIQDIVDGFTDGTLNPWCGMSGRALLADGTYQTITDAPCLSDLDQLTMQWFVDGYTGEAPTNQEPVSFGK